MSNTWTRIDDTDPRIAYAGLWTLGGIQYVEYNGTTHGARNSPAASMSLIFDGTQAKVFATLDARDPESPNPIYDIYIDEEFALTYSPNLTSIVQYKQSIFSSPILDNGEHTLLITNRVESFNAIWLDFFDFFLPDPTSSTEPLSDASTSVRLPTSTIQQEGSSGAASLEAKKTLTVRSIVAITLGVVGLVMTVAFLLRRWNKKREVEQKKRGGTKKEHAD
ncbi:hypothetical protein K435DRAFT_809297 [Dendrothele bispora CBS 962.96]|uniref:Uncharacterized protein n=1 Tax=Dendrothele bispora (strain CBS 962.96) TaxID=1314807 RepID=A0A4S8KYX7_DENBC|nr:hypothetical protein K435DRAFT_809297 [Dendrothele bispora CBS 962.96]